MAHELNASIQAAIPDERNRTIDSEVAALAVITDRPNLVALSYALRHPETWPADFVWDCSTCKTCAIGLALRLWPFLKLPKGQRVQETWVAREMALPLREAKRIFFCLAPASRVVTKHHWFRADEAEWRYDFKEVTPDHVADAIDRHLES